MPAGDNAAAQTSVSQHASSHPTGVKIGGVGKTTSLTEECARVHERVHAFLARAPRTKRIEQAQQQTRESLAIIGDALQRYR